MVYDGDIRPANSTDKRATAMQEPSETGVIRLNTLEDFITHTADLIPQSVRQVTVLSTNLEPEWLGAPSVTEALRQFAIQNARSQIRILVTETTSTVATSHPWLELIRRLSRVQARVIKPELLDTEPMKGTFVLSDRKGIVYRALDSGAWQGFAHYDDRATVRKQLDIFEQYWRYSEESPEFRTLAL